jgi:hypothetical protein
MINHLQSLRVQGDAGMTKRTAPTDWLLLVAIPLLLEERECLTAISGRFPCKTLNCGISTVAHFGIWDLAAFLMLLLLAIAPLAFFATWLVEAATYLLRRRTYSSTAQRPDKQE